MPNHIEIGNYSAVAQRSSTPAGNHTRDVPVREDETVVSQKTGSGVSERIDQSKRPTMRVVYLSPPRTPPPLTFKYAQAILEGGADIRVWSSQTHVEDFSEGIVRSTVPIQRFPTHIYAGERLNRLYGYGLGLIPKPSYLTALMRCGADVFIASHPEDLPIARLGAILNRARLVYIPFDYFTGVLDATPEQLKRWWQLEKRYSRVVHAWVSGGEKLSEKYLQEYPELENRIHIVYGGLPKCVPHGSHVLRQRIGIDSNAIVVLYQGLISKARGLWDVVDAMPYLPKNIHFVVIGGYENAQLRAYSQHRNVADRVHVLDFVPQNELPSYTAGADIGIIPIQPVCDCYRYCNPSKLFEFIAMGLPLVVSSLDQLDWYVRKNGLGEVFAPGSIEGIVKSIERLASDPDYRRQCATNSRKVQMTEACWEIQAERLRRAVLGVSQC